LQRDIDAGHVRTQPAERVIERVVQPAYPSTAAGWAAALQELAAQVHAGQIQPWERDRIRHAAGLVTAALDAVNTPAPTAPQDDRVRLLVLRLAATSAGTGQPTTLARLAAELGIAVDAVRSVLAQLTRAGVLALTRAAPTGVAEADPDRIAEHARFAVVVRPPRR
jgi:hypothetical protein